MEDRNSIPDTGRVILSLPKFDSRHRQGNFIFTVSSRTVMGPFGALSKVCYGSAWQEVNPPKNEADHSTRSSVRAVAYRGILFGWVGSKNHLRAEGRENGDLGAVPRSQGFRSICKWVKPVFLLGCYGCIFPRNWEFGSALLKLRNFGVWG
jgi:hypothetical protein